MKTIAAALVTAKSQPVVLTSRMSRLGPLADGSYLRFTSIDKDEVYDFGGGIGADGLGPQVFHAATGLQMTTIESTNDLSVDNAEMQTLVPTFPMPGITEAMVRAGKLDTIRYIVIEHDCVNGLAGEHEVMAAGVLGECRFEQGMVAIPELRSWSQLFDQTGIISQTCIDCRTKQFGSQEGEEREWCGFDITAEWVPFTVTSVGTETVREFYADGLLAVDYPPESGEGYFAPGLVRMLTGDNAGASVEVESFTGGDGIADAYVSLRFTTREPHAIGDTGEIRRECTRKWEGHNSCQTYHGTDRGGHFNGEQSINIGDTPANSIPGVNSTTSTGGTGE